MVWMRSWMRGRGWGVFVYSLFLLNYKRFSDLLRSFCDMVLWNLWTVSEPSWTNFDRPSENSAEGLRTFATSAFFSTRKSKKWVWWRLCRLGFLIIVSFFSSSSSLCWQNFWDENLVENHSYNFEFGNITTIHHV